MTERAARVLGVPVHPDAIERIQVFNDERSFSGCHLTLLLVGGWGGGANRPPG